MLKKLEYICIYKIVNQKTNVSCLCLVGYTVTTRLTSK